MEPTDRSRYDPRIDVLRSIAFLMVAADHFSVPTWTDTLREKGLILTTVVLGLIHTGWLGVPLFLFISGYSLALGKCTPSYELDTRQFFTNRLLRIFPVWVTCILILAFTHGLKGADVLTLSLLQTQDLPPGNPFNIAWSIRLEFTCYLVFPILLAAVAKSQKVIYFFMLFLFVRLGMYYIPPVSVWGLSYQTLFGGGTLFLAGILTASIRPVRDQLSRSIYLTAGVVLFCGISVFAWKSGGYANPQGRALYLFFLFMPEILGLTIFLLLRGALSDVPPRYSAKRSLDGSQAIAMIREIRRFTFATFTHIGRVSYSGYMFSLFVLDFFQHFLGIIKPAGWPSFLLAFALYTAILCVFATVSYNAIELPFLRMRRRYVHSTSGIGRSLLSQNFEDTRPTERESKRVID